MSKNIVHFAVKSIGLSRVNGRKPCTLLEAASHNLREIQAEQGATGHIDPARSHRNSILHGATSAIEVQAHAKKLLSAAGINEHKLRRDHCQAIEVVFSLPQDTTILDNARYFSNCLAWLAEALRLPVLSAVVHRDESAIHSHVLLLPLENGMHVGSRPIAQEALKRLRESFFNKVAGPAGLQRTGAKMRGLAKQWAIATVFERCEALGLPTANGPMWPILANAIKRDPVDSILALGIDVHTIRPTDKPQRNEPTESPIGVTSNPMGIQTDAAKHQSLSCVGFTPAEHSKPPSKAIHATNELSALVDCTSHWKDFRPSKWDIVRTAEQRAIARHTCKPAKPVQPPSVRMDDDGITRVRDEYTHDLSAWD